VPTALASPVTAAIRSSPPGPVLESDGPTAPPLFLHVDDDVGLAQFFSQACVLALQLQIFFFQWIALGLGSSLLRSQRFEDAAGPFTPPGGQ
jgi:hypothetical protein